MFLSLPDPDPLVRDTDPDPSSKKNLDSYCFVTFNNFFIFENYVNVGPSKSTRNHK
jgi:hypothetical protein